MEVAHWGQAPPTVIVRHRNAYAHAAPGVETNRVAALTTMVLVASTVGVAVVVRFWSIGGIGFNSDEAVYAGQAAALSGHEALSAFFTPFRAHPLLVQSLLAGVFTVTGPSDVVARVFVVAVFGLGSLAAAAALVYRAYGKTAALVTVGILAVVPYHVVLSRQVLLDVPMTMFLVLGARALFLAVVRGRRWWYTSAVWMGLAVATKETAVLFVVVALIFVLWSGYYRELAPREVIRWIVLFAIVVAPFAFTRIVFGGHNAGGYLVYQMFRPPNHPWWYFAVVLWEFVTLPVLVAAAVGFARMLWRQSTADKLMLTWFGVFALFHQAWPTKLYPYMMSVTPVIAVAAATGIQSVARTVSAPLSRLGRDGARAAVVAVLSFGLVVSLVPPALLAASNEIGREEGPLSTDVEVQDFAGGREAGVWVGDHTPPGSVFLTIGPSVGNILSFYGLREWYALSVSRDPALRNPAYRPLVNPDLAVRTLRVHYAVWDAYSADRSVFYNAMLMRLVRRHGGKAVFSVWAGENGDVRTATVAPDGADVRIVVYDLIGGDPLSAPVPEVVDR